MTISRERKLVSHPRSRMLSRCLLVSRRGSPLPSTATASSSSKLGATNRSFKWCFLRASVSSPSLAAVNDNDAGRTIGKVRQWYKNCCATSLMLCTSASTSAGAPRKCDVSNSTGSFCREIATQFGHEEVMT